MTEQSSSLMRYTLNRMNQSSRQGNEVIDFGAVSRKVGIKTEL